MQDFTRRFLQHSTATLTLLVFAFLLHPNALHAATVYKCKNEDGSTTISQFPCAPSSSSVDVSVGSGSQGRGPIGLSSAEREILAEAEKRRKDNIRARQKQAKQQHKQARKRETLEVRCSKAKEHLETVRGELRKGYSATHADYYKQRLEDAKEYAADQCDKLREL